MGEFRKHMAPGEGKTALKRLANPKEVTTYIPDSKKSNSRQSNQHKSGKSQYGNDSKFWSILFYGIIIFLILAKFVF